MDHEKGIAIVMGWLLVGLGATVLIGVWVGVGFEILNICGG